MGAERGEEVETEEAAPQEVISDEVWIRRATARQKQIDIGKATPEYTVSKQTGNCPSKTPDPRERISKRAFDRQLSTWRRCLHSVDHLLADFTKPQNKENACTPGPSQRAHSDLSPAMTVSTRADSEASAYGVSPCGAFSLGGPSPCGNPLMPGMAPRTGRTPGGGPCDGFQLGPAGGCGGCGGGFPAAVDGPTWAFSGAEAVRPNGAVGQLPGAPGAAPQQPSGCHPGGCPPAMMNLVWTAAAPGAVPAQLQGPCAWYPAQLPMQPAGPGHMPCQVGQQHAASPGMQPPARGSPQAAMMWAPAIPSQWAFPSPGVGCMQSPAAVSPQQAGALPPRMHPDRMAGASTAAPPAAPWMWGGKDQAAMSAVAPCLETVPSTPPKRTQAAGSPRADWQDEKTPSPQDNMYSMQQMQMPGMPQAPRMAVAPHNMVFVDATGVPEAGQNQVHTQSYTPVTSPNMTCVPSPDVFALGRMSAHIVTPLPVASSMTGQGSPPVAPQRLFGAHGLTPGPANRRQGDVVPNPMAQWGAMA